MFEIFNTDLLRTGAQLRAEVLAATMRASRQRRVGYRMRLWAGRELIRAGEALSGENRAMSNHPPQAQPFAR